MSMKRLVYILIGVTILAFGIGFLSLNISGEYPQFKRYGHNGDVDINSDGINIDADDATVNIGPSGINVDADGTKVKIGPFGIFVNDGEDTVDISGKGINVNGKKVESNSKIKRETINEEKIEDINDIKTINIETSFVDVNIIPEERDDIKVHYNGSVKSNYIPKLITKKSGNTFYVYAKQDNSVFSYSVNYTNLKIDVYVPNNYKDDMKIVTSSGDTKVQKGELNDLNIKTSSGDIEIKDAKLNELTVVSSSGDQQYLNISPETINLTSSSGNIKAKNIVGEINATTSSGDIEIVYEKYNDDINIATSSGDVELYLPTSSDFYLDANTNSGDIECNFPITVQGNQKRNLAGTVGSGKNKINVATSSGDLEIFSK